MVRIQCLGSLTTPTILKDVSDELHTSALFSFSHLHSQFMDLLSTNVIIFGSPFTFLLVSSAFSIIHVSIVCILKAQQGFFSPDL